MVHDQPDSHLTRAKAINICGLLCGGLFSNVTKNGATNDYLDANGSTALDMALLNESYDLIELIFAAVPSELYREDAEGMSVLAICFCRPIERWLGILKRRQLEYDDYIYQLFKSSGWFSK